MGKGRHIDYKARCEVLTLRIRELRENITDKKRDAVKRHTKTQFINAGFINGLDYVLITMKGITKF